MTSQKTLSRRFFILAVLLGCVMAVAIRYRAHGSIGDSLLGGLLTAGAIAVVRDELDMKRESADNFRCLDALVKEVSSTRDAAVRELLLGASPHHIFRTVTMLRPDIAEYWTEHGKVAAYRHFFGDQAE